MELELKKRPEKKKKWKVQSIERANKIASRYGYAFSPQSWLTKQTAVGQPSPIKVDNLQDVTSYGSCFGAVKSLNDLAITSAGRLIDSADNDLELDGYITFYTVDREDGDSEALRSIPGLREYRARFLSGRKQNVVRVNEDGADRVCYGLVSFRWFEPRSFMFGDPDEQSDADEAGIGFLKQGRGPPRSQPLSYYENLSSGRNQMRFDVRSDDPISLLSAYAVALHGLRSHGVIRSFNSPVGDIAEWIVEETAIDPDSNVESIARCDRRKRRPVSNQGTLVSEHESIKAARGCPRSRLESI